MYFPRETWNNKKEYWSLNRGWGNCNTGTNYEVICSLGGINCNVDHAFVKARNLEQKLIEMVER